MAREKYQGWTNYSTWAIHLWLTNEEPSYRYWRMAGKEAESTNDLAIRLKTEVEEQQPDLGATFWADLLTFAVQETNWYEIAKAFREKEGG